MVLVRITMVQQKICSQLLNLNFCCQIGRRNCFLFGMVQEARKLRRIPLIIRRSQSNSSIWESNGPCKSWVKGNLNKSNTLLVDDSPYKALLNPKNTAIFPSSYNHLHKESDDLLGTNGNMRGYLEGVAKCEHVQMHVQQHPFGQPAMDENHQHWDIYKTAADSIHTPKNCLIHRPTSYPIYRSFNHSYRRNQWRN